MATGTWGLVPAQWQETELLLWKPPAAWFSVNAFFTANGLRNWYVNFEHPACRTNDGFDTFDLSVDLVIDPDLSTLTWKDEDEYAHVRRLGIVTDTEHQAVELARDEVLALIADRAGPFAEADRWAGWRWNPHWPAPSLPHGKNWARNDGGEPSRPSPSSSPGTPARFPPTGDAAPTS